MEQAVINERVDYFVTTNSIEPYIFPRLKELKVDPVGFVSEFWRQNSSSYNFSMRFILYGFKYNEIFNQRLERPEGHPTWKEFIVDCLTKPMEEARADIDRGLFIRNNPGKPLPHEYQNAFWKAAYDQKKE